DEELRRDRKAIVGLRFAGELPKQGRERTPVHRYEFDLQEVSFDIDNEVYDPYADTIADLGPDHVGSVRAIDPVHGSIEIKKTTKWQSKHPRALHLFDRVPPKPLPQALHALARWIVEHGIDSAAPGHRAARDLLL